MFNYKTNYLSKHAAYVGNRNTGYIQNKKGFINDTGYSHQY